MTTAIETRLPRQVQAAAAKARQILEEDKAKRYKPAALAPNGVQVIENTEVAIPSLNTDAHPGAKPVAPAPEPNDEDGRDLAYWKHRAQTLDGALKSAKAKHVANVSDLSTQIATLQDQISELKDQLAASVPVKVEDHFTHEEIELLGEAEARVMAAKIAAAKRDSVKEVRAEMKAAAPSPKAAPPPAPDDVENPSEEDQFYNELDRLVPNWQEINKDKRWLKHCGTTDEHTGFTVQELLDAGKNRLNAPAVAKLFRDFEKSLNVVEAPPPAEAPSARNAGGRNPPSPPPPPALGRPSSAEITEHFKNRSLYFHKPEHPKHITDAQDKAFLARLQPAA